MVEVAEIFRRHGPAYRMQYRDRLLPSPLAAMEAIAQCTVPNRGAGGASLPVSRLWGAGVSLSCL